MLQVIFPEYSDDNFEYDGDFSHKKHGGIYWGFNREEFKTHVPVTCMSCHYQSAGYDISKDPHKFIVFSEGNSMSFLEFVEFIFMGDCYLWIFFLDAHQKNFLFINHERTLVNGRRAGNLNKFIA